MVEQAEDGLEEQGDEQGVSDDGVFIAELREDELSDCDMNRIDSFLPLDDI